MSYTLDINGTRETGDLSVLQVGANVKVRVFTNRIHMTSGFESGIETVGVVTRVLTDDGEIFATIQSSDGKKSTLSFQSEESKNTDRIVQKA